MTEFSDPWRFGERGRERERERERKEGKRKVQL